MGLGGGPSVDVLGIFSFSLSPYSMRRGPASAHDLCLPYAIALAYYKHLGGKWQGRVFIEIKPDHLFSRKSSTSGVSRDCNQFFFPQPAEIMFAHFIIM